MKSQFKSSSSHVCMTACLLAMIILSIMWQVLSPSDIDDNEQPITLSHFMDVALHGHWLAQVNPFEGVSHKPPVYHWIGGVSVMLLGTGSQGAIQFPSIFCFLVTSVLVLALARTTLQWPGALLATGFWMANFHSLKLGTTVRPDIALAMFMTLAILAMQYQIKLWNWPLSQKRPLAYWVWLLVLWLAVALALLTKGPPALLVAAMVTFMLWWNHRLLSRDTWPHALGLVLAVAVFVGWLWLCAQYYPQLDLVLNKEWSRLVGDQASVKRYPPRWREIAYFLGRFIPWSILAAAALLMLPWWKRPAKVEGRSEMSPGHPQPAENNGLESSLTWAAVWVLLVLGILAIPKGRRADHIFPVYCGACVLVAAMVAKAQQVRGSCRIITHLILGGVMLAAIAAAASAWWLPRPSPMVWPVATITPVVIPTYTTFTLVTAGLCAFFAGVFGLWFLHTRRYYHASMAGCMCMVAVLGIYNTTMNRSSENRQGDYVIAVARTAQTILASEQRKPLFYDTGYVPVQSLMGYQEQMMTYRPVQGQALLITSLLGWSTLQQQGAQGQIILQTPELDESERTLILVRPTFLPDVLPIFAQLP